MHYSTACSSMTSAQKLGTIIGASVGGLVILVSIVVKCIRTRCGMQQRPQIVSVELVATDREILVPAEKVDVNSA